MKTYNSRQEVPTEEKWNLADIYKEKSAWEDDYGKIEKITDELKRFDGHLGDAQSLYNYLAKSEELSFLYRKVYAYAMLHVDSDTRDTTFQGLLDRASQRGQKINAANSFFMPYLLSLEEETLKGFISEVEGLTYFEEDLLDSFRYKQHVLNKDQEEILSQIGEALSSPQKTYGMINNADITFGEVTDENGNKVELTRGMYGKLIEDDDREKRQEAYNAYYKPYITLQNTIASTLSAAVKNNVLISKMRNYPSAIEKSLFSDMVPLEVYENLIQATKDNMEPMHKYIRLRKQILGLDDLRQYDLSVPLVKGVKQDISYDNAFETMLNALNPLGEEYVRTLSGFKEKRYIDVRETPGKRSGAYNLGIYGVHPFILLNYQDDLDSLFTLAHECGHAMHSYYSTKHQPQITAGYSIFVAEVASTVNEILLIRYLLMTTDDKQMKKHLLNHFIDGFKGTFFTQVMFAEFEKIVHDKADRGEPLNTAAFNSVYEKLFKEYNGSDLLELDDEVKFGWSRIPHFYRPFYVYKYATGYASAIHIADRILSGDQETLESYLEFLKSGSSDYPLELLKATGVDLTKPEPIQSALAIFSGLVDEFAGL